MPDARSQIGFEQGGLGSVLKRNQLEVPPNQRDYAWTDEVKELFQDFAKAMGGDTDYFLGTIVTIPRENGALEVVDGQQRLATAALLLAAMRDHLKEKNEEVLVAAINSEFLAGYDRPRRAHVPKLKLNIDDNDLFKAIVSDGPRDDLPEPTRASHERLIAAYEEAKRHVRRLVAIAEDKDHGDILERWISFVENRALVVLLKVPDDADAYKMFETLNDRGLRTSQADLVKNHLFGKSGDRFNEVQSKWSFMLGTLESLDDDDITINFLRHVLVLMRGYLSSADVYETVEDIAKAEQSTVTFTTQLETLASVYVATFNSEHERWNDYPSAARRAIATLDLLNVKPMRALLLAVTAKLDPRETAKALSFLVSLGVRLMIAATIRSGSVETPLSVAARDIYEDRIATAAALKAQLEALAPSDSQFQEAFERARVTTAKLGRYYLRSLEMEAKGETAPWFVPQDDHTVINLEHVLPEKPQDNWPQFAEDDVIQYSKRLGNLALMRAGDNSNLKSASFAEKKAVYGKSGYELTRQIAEAQNWTTREIIERQKVLATLAVKTWPTS